MAWVVEMESRAEQLQLSILGEIFSLSEIQMSYIFEMNIYQLLKSV